MKSQFYAVYRRVFANRLFFPLDSFLLEASLHGLGTISFGDFHQTGEYHLTTKTLPKWLGEKSLVLFDVGANRGDYCKLLAETFPQSKIFAFEPHPQTFRLLNETVEGIGHRDLTTINAALGASTGELSLFDYPDSDGSTHATLCEDVLKLSSDKQASSTMVQVDTVDRFCQAHSIDHIDFLKIDTEGCDLSVVEGAKEMIARQAISCLQLEFGELHLQSRVYFYDFVDQFPGYHFFRVLPKSLVPIQVNRSYKSEIFAYQNIVAVAPEFVANCGFPRSDLRRSAA